MVKNYGLSGGWADHHRPVWAEHWFVLVIMHYVLLGDVVVQH